MKQEDLAVDYPIWDLSLGGGVLIALVAITHVWVSHFAVGGGIALALIETLAVRRGDPSLRNLARRGSLMLILISTVFGAISGVGIWVTIGLVQPAATSALIRTFVWGWAAEWGFFILEVVTALLYYATWEKVSPRTHLVLIWLYAFAAYMSLVIIQGILAFMLTPGAWIQTRSFWDGFFNPTYLPGLVLRTGICLLLAGAYLVFAAFREPQVQARAALVRLLAALQVGGALLSYGAYRWWEGSLPGDIRALFVGAKPVIAGLGATRDLLLGSLALFTLLALFAWLAPRLQRWPLAVLGLAAAFAFFGGYERLREGCRKPFVIRDVMFSNGLMASEVERLNREGALSRAAWAAHGGDGSPVAVGRAMFRAQCQACHTRDGYLSIRRLIAQADGDVLSGLLSTMQGDGEPYTKPEFRQEGRVPASRLVYPFMPPLVGTEKEVEGLKAYLLSLKGAPHAQ
ncbi:MAG: cytochrome ubiquinol oxidase subunit I [Acidobacteria bacterium]|nr:cytochrome ubiquinol oxidase subunit I [Acidobacteriota bacterium]